MNALHHGGRAALGRTLPDEDPEEAAQFRASVFEAYDARGAETGPKSRLSRIGLGPQCGDSPSLRRRRCQMYPE